MPETKVKSPSGEVITVKHPQGATQSQIIEYAKTQVKPESSPKTAEDFSGMERFIYEFRSTPSMTENLATLAEAAFPVGYFGDPLNAGNGLYTSAEEAYGEDYTELSFDERRQRVLDFQKRVEQAKYPELSKIAQEGQDMGVAGGLGGLASVIIDPTNLFPVGQGAKQVAVISGLLGGSYEATSELAETGTINPRNVALVAGGSAAGGVIIDKAVRAAVPAYNRLKTSMRKRKSLKEVEAANVEVAKIQDKIIELQASNTMVDNPVVAAAERLGMKPEKALENLSKATDTLDIPKPEVAKAIKEYKDVLDKGTVPSGFVADLIGSVSTQIKKISPVAYNAMQKFELAKSARVGNYMKRVNGFEKIEKAMPASVKNTFKQYLSNGDYDGVRKLLKDYKIDRVKTGLTTYRDTNEIIDSVQDVLEDIYKSRLTVDENAQRIENYFPRFVKDADGLRRTLGLGSKADSAIDRMLKRKADSLNKTVDELTQAQKTAVFDDYYARRTGGIGDSTPDQFKKREISQIDSEMVQYYEDPTQALMSYITRMTDDTELQRLFSNVKANLSDEGELNIDQSIGAYTQKLLDDGEIDSVGMAELRKYLDARLGAGTRSPHRIYQALKSISNTLLLGNPISATTQIGDLFVAAHRYGVKNTFGSVLKAITGKADVNVETLGLEKYIAEDLTDVGFTAVMLDKALTYSGFRAVDRLGKNTSLEAAFKMNKALAKSEKGIAKLKERWGKAFGNEFDSLVSDLKAGKVTDNTKLLLWNELSGQQPISLIEMPLKYLQAPNGRVFYSLKSFTIKQLDMLRNSVYEEYKKGNNARAAQNALSYLLLVGGGNATVQEIRNAEQGRGFDLERIPDNVFEQMFMTAMTSRYAVENKLQNGDVLGFAMESMLPPTSALQNLTKDAYAAVKALGTGEEVPSKTARSIPFIGRAWYNLFGGGAEEWLERRED